MKEIILHYILTSCVVSFFIVGSIGTHSLLAQVTQEKYLEEIEQLILQIKYDKALEKCKLKSIPSDLAISDANSLAFSLQVYRITILRLKRDMTAAFAVRDSLISNTKGYLPKNTEQQANWLTTQAILKLMENSADTGAVFKLLHQSLQIIEKEISTERSLILKMNILENIGKVYQVNGNWKMAQQYILKANEIAQGLYNNKDDLRFASITMSYASILNYNNQVYKARLHYEKALAIYFHNNLNDHPNIGVIYYNLGNSYSITTEYETSIANYLKALEKYEATYHSLHPNVLDVKAKLSGCYTLSGQLKKGQAMFNQVLGELEQEEYPNSYIAHLYFNKGADLMEAGYFIESGPFLEKAITLWDQYDFQNNSLTASLYSNYTRYLIEVKNIKEATKTSKIHRALTDKFYGSNHYSQVYVNYLDGLLYLQKSEYAESNSMFLNALQILNIDPSFEWYNYKDPILASECYLHIAQGYFRQAMLNSDTLTFQKSISALDSSEYLLTEYLYSLASENSKLRLRQTYMSLLDLELQQLNSFDQSSPEAYFNLFEKAKSQILHQNIFEKKQLQTNSEETTQLRRWIELKDKIKEYEDRLKFDNIGSPTNTEVRDSLVHFTQLAEKLKLSRTGNKGQNSSLIPQLNIPHLAKVQSALSSEEAIIHYFFTEREIAIQVIKRDEVYTKIDTAQNLDKKILQYLSLCNDPLSNISEFQETSHFLYQKLWAGLQNLPSKVIIIPFNVLFYLPFETLISDPIIGERPQWNKLNYLLKKHHISYNYSAGILNANKSVKDHSGKPLYAFAPDYTNTTYQQKKMSSSTRGNLSPLFHNKEEVLSLQRNHNFSALLAHQATVENFLVHLTNASVIHFAGHAVVEDYPGGRFFLAFSHSDHEHENSLLKEMDLNGIQSSIDLVVLSGCQTASGYVMKGEGLSSLTRSFTALGALSIVSTLWPVNDKVTTSIIEFFYDRLDQGKMKDIALSQAKLQYIETVKDLESAHPYYWASFVQFGDTRALKLNPNIFKSTKLLLAIILSGLFILSVWRRVRTQQ